MLRTFALSTIVCTICVGAGAQPAKLDANKRVLENPAGMTLYVFDRDEVGVDKTSQCNGECAKRWPPFLASTSDKASNDWSVEPRQDGSKQRAYKGRPLYTFSGDKSPGETNGLSQNGNTWHVAQP